MWYIPGILYLTLKMIELHLRNIRKCYPSYTYVYFGGSVTTKKEDENLILKIIL